MVRVVAGRELAQHCTPWVGVLTHLKGMKSAPQYPLAVERACWQGEAAVAVIADMTDMIFDGRVDEAEVAKVKEGMKLARDHLQRSGYRLPTQAEMEYACRAGATTSRYFGQTEELLDKYAWYIHNAQDRTWPLGSKKPNDLGLFDLHGNVYTWCQESHRDYPAPKDGEVVEDKEDVLSIDRTSHRVLRGGSFGHLASFVRCANRDRFAPTLRGDDVGFRPARTFTP